MKRRFGLLIALAVLLLDENARADEPAASQSTPSTTRFVAIGHARMLFPSNMKIFRRLAKRINQESPDYVFLLGDMTPSSKTDAVETLHRHFLDQLDAPYYWAPGNHDLAQGVINFIALFGRTYRLIRDANANFLTINSNDEIETIRKHLEPLFAEIKPDARNKPTILFSHHRIWLDLAPPERRRVHFPSYDWKEMRPLLAGRIGTIVAGDSNLKFESGERDGIGIFSVGIGMKRGSPLHFSVGTIEASGALEMRPVFLDLSPDHPWNRKRAKWRRRGTRRVQ